MNNNLSLFELSNIIIMTHQQVGVVKALIAFSSKFNLAVTSALVVIAVAAKLEVDVRVNAVLPVALTYENTIDVV